MKSRNLLTYLLAMIPYSVLWIFIFFLFAAPLFRPSSILLDCITCIFFGVLTSLFIHEFDNNSVLKMSVVSSYFAAIIFSPLYLLDWDQPFQIWPLPTLVPSVTVFIVMYALRTLFSSVIYVK